MPGWWLTRATPCRNSSRRARGSFRWPTSASQRNPDRTPHYQNPVNISVIGTGYVGLVVGACLAETGNDVTCADTNVEKIEGLRKNIIPIFEPGLDTMVERNQHEGRPRFT